MHAVPMMSKVGRDAPHGSHARWLRLGKDDLYGATEMRDMKCETNLQGWKMQEKLVWKAKV